MTDHQAYHLLGNIIRVKAAGTRTNNAYSLVEITSSPGAGTPPHRQMEDDEAFMVLQGTYEFMHNGRTINAKAGDFLFVAKGEPHAFRNAGEITSKMLIINSPAGLHENFFREAGDPIGDNDPMPAPTAPDLQRIGAAAARYGIELLI